MAVIPSDDIQDKSTAAQPTPTVTSGGRGGVSTRKAPVPQKPSPGILHAAERAGISTLADLSQFESNVASIPAKIPGTVLFPALAKTLSENAAKHRKQLEQDTAVGGESQTGSEKLTENVLGTVGSSIPYLVGPEGAIGAGVTGVIQNLDKGPKEAIKGGLKAATFSKAAGLLGKEVEGAVNKTPGLRNAPPVVKRAVTGSATAAALSPKGEGSSNAIVGGVAGASQKEPASNNEIRANKLMAATGKTNGDAWTAYKVAGPAMEETANLTGKQPGTPKELESNIQDTLSRLQEEYQGYLNPVRSQQVWGTPIADAIRNRAREAEINGVTTETKKIGDKLEERAKEFEKQFTLGSLDDLRQLYFENLHGTAKEALQERSSADVRADRIAEDAIKDMLYPIVDVQAQQAGKPAGYVRGTLKAQQANLIQLKDSVKKRTAELNEKEGIRRGTPLMQRVNVTSAVHPSTKPTGVVVASVHGLTKFLFGDPDSAKEVNKRITESFPVKQTSPKDRVPAIVAASQSKSTTPPPNASVRMKTPDGTMRSIPIGQVEDAKKRGAVVIQ